MTVTLEDRVEVLEGKVEKNLEVLTEFRREVNGKLDEFGETQAKQSQTLDMHTGKLTGINKTVDGFRLELFVARNDRKEFREEISGTLERLDNDATWIKKQIIGEDGLLVGISRDVTSLGDQITGLRGDVTALRVDVTGRLDRLEGDVTGLKNDMVDVKGTLAEILDRLPAKAA